MNQAEPLWQVALSVLEKRVQRPTFSAFIVPLIPLELSENALILQGLDTMMCELIRSNYGRIIEETLEEICGQHLDLEIIASVNAAASNAEEHSDTRAEQEASSRPQRTGTAASARASKSLDHAPIHTNPVRDQAYNRLDPRYTFDRFIRGKSNELPHDAALAVAEAPARAYNPLFIYGDVGLGKTHLMQAVGHALLARHPEYKVIYIPFESFLNDFVAAIRNKSEAAFRNRYREVDLLLVDDIQFIVGTRQTQDEFFHTFNSLYNTQKQIIISCDRPPREIQNLYDRIRSRFEAGLTADIQRPDLETRLAILQAKAREEHILVVPEVFSYIATRVTSNIRELEGALLRLKAKAAVDSVLQITLPYAAEALKEILDPAQTKQVSIDLIQEIVAGYYQLTTADLKAKRRSQELVVPRQIAMYFCRELTDQSLPKIGEAFDRDHTTVIHAVNKVQELRRQDAALSSQLNDLMRQIRA